MVSVRQLEKKNALSAELKKHGFAVDNSQAFELAEQIYDRKRTSPEVAFADEQQVLIMEPEADSRVEELKNRIKKLERKNAFAQKREEEYENRIGELTSKMNEMVKSINLIEKNQQAFSRKLSKFKNSGGSSNDPSSDSSPQKTSEDEAPSSSESSSQKEGEYAPEDVAVEKIFYSGTNS